MEVFLDVSQARAIGDTICCTPTLRKLYHSYNRKVSVISEHLEVFENNPYVQKCYKPNALNVDFIKEKTLYHNSFWGIGQKNELGVEYKHNNIDIRQFHAMTLGFMLSPDEMECDFIPRQYQDIQNLPEKYVLIHPVQTWPNRTWSSSNWMKLTKKLNDLGISVVSIGKDSSEKGFFNIYKPTFNFKIKDGLNLMNKTSLSQDWHLIDKLLNNNHYVRVYDINFEKFRLPINKVDYRLSSTNDDEGADDTNIEEETLMDYSKSNPNFSKNFETYKL
jgi:ADP-heptose:LPS heptosyltransferase